MLRYAKRGHESDASRSARRRRRPRRQRVHTHYVQRPGALRSVRTHAVLIPPRGEFRRRRLAQRVRDGRSASPVRITIRCGDDLPCLAQVPLRAGANALADAEAQDSRQMVSIGACVSRHSVAGRPRQQTLHCKHGCKRGDLSQCKTTRKASAMHGERSNLRAGT